MCPSLKREGMVAMVVLAALVLMMGNAWAQARKTTVNATVSDAQGSEGDVIVNYTIKGVGNEDLCVVITVRFTANCACRNNGANCPSDAKKQTVDRPVMVGSVDEPRNGQINGSQPVPAPTDADCQEVLNCPGNNQTAILAELIVGSPITLQVFDQFVLTDTTTCTFVDNDQNDIPDFPPIRVATITPSPSSFQFDEGCADLFD